MANRFGSFLYIRDAFPSWSFDMILANGLEALASRKTGRGVIHTRDKEAEARIIAPPADHVYGEWQYTAEDLAGHRWTFSQAIADVHPASWGVLLVE